MIGTTGKFGPVLRDRQLVRGAVGTWGSSSSSGRCSRGRVFGLHTTATGGNELGAAEAGVPVRSVKIWCFIIIALISGFIGIIDAIRIGSLDPAAPGLNEMLSGVTAAVIGGTALTGGRRRCSGP